MLQKLRGKRMDYVAKWRDGNKSECPLRGDKAALVSERNIIQDE